MSSDGGARVTAVGVIGGGAWGTAIAQLVAMNGHDVFLWAREADVVDAINRTHQNPDFLPGVALAPSLAATDRIADVATNTTIFLTTPAQYLRATVGALAGRLAPGTRIAICAKGVEASTGALMSEIVAACLPDAVPAVLSGPTFATEVAAGKPTAATLACADEAAGAVLIELLSTRTFRPYLGRDLIGTQVGGAVKNVLAIACGIVAGRELGDNARAALITRGLAEMLRFGRALGAEEATLMGLSGLGDLVLTCTGPMSRNYSLGVALGRGQSAADFTRGKKSVAEGVATARAVIQRATVLGVDMPIVEAVHAVIDRDASIDEAIAALLARPLKHEGTDRLVERLS